MRSGRAPRPGEELSARGTVEWPPGEPPETLTEALVAAEGSTIVVDPDPARGARLLNALRAAGRDAVSLAGDSSGSDRTAAWSRARGGACVVVGGRVAIWAPVPDLTTIVVIDEGDEALEEERAPTWNARDVARERARRSDAGIVLVTPAPTVDARHALGEPVVPARPFVRASWPRVDVVDLRREAPGHWLLTEALADALRRVRDRGGRSVCVLNRRGRARLLACVACGEAARCEACGATVVEGDEGLVCLRCDTARPSICLQCHDSRLRAVKPGIARVRDDLAALLPRALVSAIDADSDAIPDSDVLVGTEAVLHRAGSAFGHAAGAEIGMVAFLEFDQELLAPRARAAEQALWLLVRGARLLGRRDRGGLLLLQTRMPDHEVVLAAVTATPSAVTDAEWERRQALGFPPFGGVAELSGEATAVGAACDTLRDAGVRVLGPTQVQGKPRALVHAASPDALSDALALPGIEAAGARGRLRIDVDPRRA